MTKEDGFISIYRKFLSWEWFDDERSVKIFIYLLLKANWKRRRWRGQWIERGQFITSTVKLAAELNMNRTTVIRNLKRFQESGEIVIKADTQKSVITICKYDNYQIKNEEVEQREQQPKRQPKQQREDSKSNSEGNSKSNTTNKGNKENKENKDNKVKGKPSFLDFSNYLKKYLGEKKIKVSDPQIIEIAENFFNHYNANGWKVGKNPLVDWTAAARNSLKWDKNASVLNIQIPGAAKKTGTGAKFPDYYDAEFVRRHCQDAASWGEYRKHLISLGFIEIQGGQGTTWSKKPKA
tara:strand:- start:825 stop:1706 length:882 start_codon:yes stop_codon:yes gene_type:complete